MDQLQGSGGTGGTGTVDPGAGSGGGAATIQGQPGTGQTSQGGGGGLPWESDERFRGKGPADVWKSYTELQKKAGGLPDLEKKLGQWEQFGKAWEPYLQHVGWDPQRLAKALEQAAQSARAQGRTGEANQLQAQADQAWGDALTPESQEKWIGNRFQQSEAKMQQELQRVSTALVDYFNRFGDLALRAIEQKFANPKIAINELLQEAVNIATNRYDPLEWAAKIRSAEPPQEMEARIRADERAKVEAEAKNRALTTFSGTGTGSPRVLKPRTTPAAAQNGQAVPRVPEAEAISRGRERFAQRWSEIAQE